jgi:hypothetical protein
MAITKMRFSRDFEENVEPGSSQPDPTFFAASTSRANVGGRTHASPPAATERQSAFPAMSE